LEDIRKQHLKVGVFNGTSYPKFLKEHGLKNSMWIYPTQREMFLAFEAGKIDAMLMDEHIARHYQQIEKYPLTLAQNPVRADKIMAFSVRKEDLQLATQLNQVIATMQADGTSEAIRNKWLNKGKSSELALKGAP
jgi:ABC-type amino acid transport substrate-binding protein